MINQLGNFEVNMNLDYLFVYGTLKLEATNQYAKYFHQQAEYLGQAKWAGRLYLVSYYPGAVPSNSNQEFVYGELWKLINPDKTLNTLDEYEECSDRHPLPHEYKRSQEKVWFGEKVVDAWIYIYQANPNSLKRINSGIFLNTV